MSARASGAALLATLVDLARRQRAALAADDLDSFDALADAREPLVGALAAADWTRRAAALALGGELAAIDRENEATLRRRLEETKDERARAVRNARALRGYAGSAAATSPASPLLDRKA